MGEAILPLYQDTLRKLEEIIRREARTVSRSGRRASALRPSAQPAPNMRPPRLVGNTREQGEFILPSNIPAKDPGQQKGGRLHVRRGGVDAHRPRGRGTRCSWPG